MSSAPKQRRVLLRDQPVDIFVAGYLLTKDMVKHLCLLAYGATQADIDHFGALDFAALYYSERDVIESPSLIPVTYYNHSNTIEDGWLLPGRAAFHSPRVSPPKLEYDKATKAYLDQWLPPHLLKRDEFKGIRYVQTPWPRGVVPLGAIRTRATLMSKKHRAIHDEHQKAWLKYMEDSGVSNPVIPPPFPVSWHLE